MPALSRPLTTVNCFRKGARGCMIGVISKPAPVVFGVQFSMTMPIGTYIAAKRMIGSAAVLPTAVKAGTMPSSRGNASVVPIPRSTVRRLMAFFVMNITRLPSIDTETACC